MNCPKCGEDVFSMSVHYCNKPTNLKYKDKPSFPQYICETCPHELQCTELCHCPKTTPPTIEFEEETFFEDEKVWEALFVKINGKLCMAYPVFGTEDKDSIIDIIMNDKKYW